MPRQLDWSLSFPIQDGVLPDDTLIVKSRGTSGAGQFEVAGAAKGPSGQTIRARDVVGKQITFVLPAPVGDAYIRLAMSYPVQEVGGKVRVSVKSDSVTRPNVGNLFAAAFMLPDVSSREQSLPFDESDLGEKTYWIDDVSCRVFAVNDGSIVLEPDEFILASSNKNDASQFSAMASFDYKDRLKTLYKVCVHGAASACGPAKSAFAYYRDYLIGKIPFEFEMASFMKGYIMAWLEENDAAYKRTEDPLPTLAAGIPEVESAAPARINVDKPRNWIFFGAPGTGKSYQLNQLANSFAKENVSRVTFYPDYTYSQFVGCYKPCTDEDGDITYDYVAGPFLDTYLNACTHPHDQYLLIIEEINRANPAAVFGDIFQLLDRNAGGWSEYSVAVPDDMKKHIAKRLGTLTKEEQGAIEAYYDPDMDFDEFGSSAKSDLALPPNMFIWATMNSADQGVYPMDTAFKRRWDFRYIGIDDGEDAEVSIADEKRRLSDVSVSWGKEGTHKANWNTLRKAINGFLSNDVKLNEDKLLGPFFVTPSSLTDERFGAAFKDKVLLYLYEDACKTKHSKVFAGDLNTYSAVCEAFDERGTGIFVDGFKSHYKEGASVASEDNASPEE